MGKFFFQSWTQNLGRNGWDQPLAIPEDMSAESFNVELREGGLGKKRLPLETVTLTGLAAGGTSFLGRFVPGNDAADQEMFLVNNGTALYRLPGNEASGVSLSTTTISTPVIYAQLNGKFYIACPIPSSVSPPPVVNRIQVYAPDESTTTIRLAGLKAGGAPSVANTGAGTYAAVIRYYRVRFRAIVSGVVVRTSEASASTAFTPSGGGTAARVTQGTLPGEGETHWVIEASQDDEVFWELGQVAIGTTTYDDSVLPANYPSVGTVPPLVGSCYPFPSCRFILSDGTRLYGLGTYETSAGDSVFPVNGRLYFTPIIGASDLGDDERIVNDADTSGWIDVAIGAGGSDVGLGGPINGTIFAFQTDRVTAFIQTGNPNAPLRRIQISDKIGAMSHQSIVMAEDESGQPALYWLDPKGGPYRIGYGNQVQYLGKDVRDLWTPTAGANLYLSAFGAYDPQRKLVIWKVPTSATRQQLIVFDVTNGRMVNGNEVRKGWMSWGANEGASSTYLTSAISFSSSLASSHSIDETIYFSQTELKASTALLRRYSASGTESFQAYVKSKAYRWKPLGRLKRLLESILVAKSTAATTIRVMFTKNWGEQSLSQTISVAPVGSELYVRPRPNPVDMTDIVTVQEQIGDASANTSTWELEATEMQVEELEQAR